NSTGLLNKGEFQALIGYRHFKSFRHFRGKHEEPNRVAEGTEVINYFNSFDLGLSYSVTNRLSVTAVLPVTFNDRSSMYEHYGNSEEANPERKRFETNSTGIGDLRLSATYWLLNPHKYMNGNFAVGLGIKAPTGNDGVEDDFHKLDSVGNDYTIRRAVDQSIQLGDGGWGVNLEVQGYHSLFKSASVYFNGFYLANPRHVNNTLRNINLDPADPHSYLSVADQYAARLGLSYNVASNFAVSAGSRIEGIPSSDLIGESKGMRRPGYIISVEPGVSYARGNATFTLNTPIAVFRNRVQSVRDIERTEETGNYTIGDAAFADYLINATVTYRFGGEKMEHQPMWKEAPSGGK
ncbi:MAG: hypothetical protein AAB316_17750, partial [Bacteroidota bacterium]